MAQFGNNNQEGQSTNRPPLLFGTENYNFWKFRMRIYLKRDPWEWWVVENGPVIPRRDDGTPKILLEMDSTEIYMVSYDSKAMNTLLSGMVQSEIDKVSSCNTAKEMWDTLVVSHEGTSKVREVKLSMLMHDYEMFKLDKDETIKLAQARFLVLINSLKLLDKTIPQSEINRKLLRAMPKRFASKITTLQDSATISTMDTLTLFGELEEYEHQLKRYDDEEETPRRKVLALNAGNEEELENDSDEEIAMMSRRLKGLLQRKNKRKNAFNSNKFKGKQNEETCFECGRPGHFKKDCFQLKNKGKTSYKDNKKNKAFLTWDDDDEPEVEIDAEDEIAQVCFVGIEGESNEVSLSEFNILKEENEKLKEKNAYLKDLVSTLMDEVDSLIDEKKEIEKDTICKEEKVLIAKNSYLENYNKILLNKVTHLNNEVEKLTNEIKMRDVCIDAFGNESHDNNFSINELHKEIESLKLSLSKFVQGEENLAVMLGKQRPSYEKQGIGYKTHMKRDVKMLKSKSRFKLNYCSPFTTCKNCGIKGHLEANCLKKKNKTKTVWIKKGDLHVTNTSGPKKIWVPKG